LHSRSAGFQPVGHVVFRKKNLQTMIAILVCGGVEWFRIKKCFFTSENIKILSEGISSPNEYGYTRISHGNARR
jgi:hypothetical protein